VQCNIKSCHFILYVSMYYWYSTVTDKNTIYGILIGRDGKDSFEKDIYLPATYDTCVSWDSKNCQNANKNWRFDHYIVLHYCFTYCLYDLILTYGDDYNYSSKHSIDSPGRYVINNGMSSFHSS